MTKAYVIMLNGLPEAVVEGTEDQAVRLRNKLERAWKLKQKFMPPPKTNWHIKTVPLYK